MYPSLLHRNKRIENGNEDTGPVNMSGSISSDNPEHDGPYVHFYGLRCCYRDEELVTIWKPLLSRRQLWLGRAHQQP